MCEKELRRRDAKSSPSPSILFHSLLSLPPPPNPASPLRHRSSFIKPPSQPASLRLSKILSTLAQRFPRTKFISIIGSQCIENYPDRNLPTLIVYRNGDVTAQIVGADGVLGKGEERGTFFSFFRLRTSTRRRLLSLSSSTKVQTDIFSLSSFPLSPVFFSALINPPLQISKPSSSQPKASSPPTFLSPLTPKGTTTPLATKEIRTMRSGEDRGTRRRLRFDMERLGRWLEGVRGDRAGSVMRTMISICDEMDLLET